MEVHGELKLFLKDELQPEKQRLSKEFQAALLELTEQKVPRYRMKYILGKMSQYLDGAYENQSLSSYVDAKSALSKVVGWEPGEAVFTASESPLMTREDFHHIGNILQVDRSDLFELKLKKVRPEDVIADSRFALTRHITDDLPVLTAEPVSKKKTQGSNMVNKRTTYLRDLALQVWDVQTQTKV
jgi:hypothetical protein